MNIINTAIPDVLVLEPRVFGDDRGFFMESYNRRFFNDTVYRDVDFVQDNHSRSTKGVLRGLHYQIQQAQGKLVRCVLGEIFDVAVDIRKSSPTFGKWIGVTLSAKNKHQVWVPEGLNLSVGMGSILHFESVEHLLITARTHAEKYVPILPGE